MNTFQSGRAAHAFAAVQAAVSDKDLDNREFRSSAKKLPMLIKTNGLLPALLFAEIKSQYGSLTQVTLNWLISEGSPVRQYFRDVNDPLSTDHLTSLDSEAYRMVTIEVQRYLTWIRRFADGIELQNNKSNG